MAIAGLEWVSRHRYGLLVGLVALLVLVIAFESFLLYEQRAAIRATEAYSAKLLTTFLEDDTTQVSGAPGVPIRLQNVQFKWSDKVYIDTGNMAVRAVPVRGRVVDFDDLDSFHLTLQQSVVFIRPDVLEGMFNESVFNYPHSKLRSLKVKLERDDGAYVLRVSGSVNVGLWIPFRMNAHLNVDQTTNTLTIDVDHLRVFGVVPVTKLIKLEPFQLQHLISMPPNKSLMVDGNRMMVKPFGLFPPPRVEGRMSSVTLDEKGIHLAFAGRPIPAPESSAKNYVYLKGGTAQFGRFCMVETDILIVDQDQSDPFVFSLLGYEKRIPRSRLDIHDTQSVRVAMPDL
jgi:hypothetical protein